jgi:glutamate--cysteine ligase
MSLDAPSKASPVIGSLDELVSWIRKGEKPVEQHRCGVETEKIGVVEATGGAVPLTGERSIAAILRGLAGKTGGELLLEHDVPIGVQLADSSIALEPGGQLELSGAPSAFLHDSAREIAQHLEETRKLSKPLGLAWLAVGYRPFGARPAVPWLPRGRYGLMRKRLPGAYAHDMMQMTASVQANFDFADEADLASKVACATAASPLVAALFANSPLKDGKPAGAKSFRYYLWRDVDATRSGLLRAMYEPGFTYRRYLDWAFSAPLLFVRRQGQYVDPEGRTFHDILRDGFAGEPATMQDFVDLLSTLFPEIRVKRVLEVRGADAVNEETTLALPALWTGLLYDATARADARRLMDMPFESLIAFQQDIAVEALEAKHGTVRALDLARDLLRLADDGLRRRFEAGVAPDERGLLDPLRQIAQTGRTGADAILDVYRSSNGDQAALIEAMRY